MKIKSLSISGYKSFGEEQFFEGFSKVNFFIGKNNCGKSNVISFIHNVYSNAHKSDNIKISKIDFHLNSGFDFYFSIDLCNGGEFERAAEEIFRRNSNNEIAINKIAKNALIDLLKFKAESQGKESAWMRVNIRKEIVSEDWEEAFRRIGERLTQTLSVHLASGGGGGNVALWKNKILRCLFPEFPRYNSYFVPAIRQVNNSESESDDFSGSGIIQKLMALQNPTYEQQAERSKFDKINHFLRSVTGSQNATINVPHNQETILVNIDDTTLPLDSLGTGIHEVIILATAATVVENSVICMEEPELHLNPILQKKLVRYLSSATNNQYFITTHSASLMDTPGCEIYHISLREGRSISNRVTSDRLKSEVCHDLGCHPSDLIQSNCIIWVEGPSDRIYINYWLSKKSPELIEGEHYSIMFYGGKLAKHISGQHPNDATEAVNDFISLRRLNQRAVIILDSDRDSPHNTHINNTKKRLRDEFNSGPGFTWITEGREVENYIPADELRAAIYRVHPRYKIMSNLGKFDNCLLVQNTKGTKTQASKVEVARSVVKNSLPDLSIYKLEEKIEKIRDFIIDSNPAIEFKV